MREISRRSALRAGMLAAGLAAAGPLTGGCGSGTDQPAGPAGRTGGTLRFGGIGSATAVTTDPHGGIPSESDWARMSALYDVLTMPGPDGGVRPWLATSWSSEPGARRHRFALRTDATFSDGRPVRAADVLFSLRRIAGKTAENGGRIGTIDVAGSQADGQHAVLLATSVPDAEVARAVAGQCFIVPEGTESFDQPVGSGPFALSSLRDATAALRRNERWWGDGPKVDALEIRAFADPQALATAVTSGEIDLAANVGYPTARSAEQTGRLRVVRRPGAASYPLVMNLAHPPFDRVEVRRAVKLAVDRPALVNAVLLGYGRPGNDAPFPADSSYPADLAAPGRDLAQARSLLRQAGHGDGFDVEIHATTSYPSMISAATLLGQQLAEVGIRARVREHPPETYWAEVYTKVPLYIGYTTDALPIQHWATATTLSTAPFNETGWRRPQFDTAFAAAMATADAGQRRQLLGQLQRQLADEGGWVMWGLGDGVDVAAPGVRDVPTASGFARYSMAGVWLDS